MSIIELKIVHAEHAAIGVVAVVAIVAFAFVWVRLGYPDPSKTHWRAP